MEGLLILLSVVIVAQTVKDIFEKIYPTKKELLDLKDELSALRAKYEKIDMDKIDSLRGDLNSLKMSTPAPRRSR